MIGRRITVTVFASILATSSYAGVPTADGANLAQNIARNIMDASQWAQEKGLKLMDMDLNALMGKLGIENQNNAMANMIVRSGKAMQDIQNKDIAEKSVPADTACDVTAGVEASKQVEEVAAERKQRNAYTYAVSGNNLENAQDRRRGSTDTSDVKAVRREVAQDIMDTCARLQSVEPGDVDPKAPLATSFCLHGHVLTSTAPGTMTQEESEALDVMNRVVAGALPEMDTLALSDDVANIQSLDIARREILQGMAYGSLQEVSAWYQPAIEGISPMMTLEKAVEAHYNPKELAKMANADPETKNSDMPSEVTRKIAQMEALGLHISQERFKSDLRREALLSALLAIEIKPLAEQ